MEVIERRTGKPITQAIRDAVAVSDSLSGAARILGVSRDTLRKWMRDFGIGYERRMVIDDSDESVGVA